MYLRGLNIYFNFWKYFYAYIKIKAGIFINKLGSDFKESTKIIDTQLRVDESFDLIKRELDISGTSIAMYYIDGFVKAEIMQRLMQYFMTVKDFGDNSPDAAEKFSKTSIPAVEVDVTDSADTVITMVLAGCTAFFAEGFGGKAIIIDARTYPARESAEPENDKVMRGSRDGFVETLIFNTALIRRRIRSPEMTVKYLSAGSDTRTDLALCYMNNRADEKYVKYLTEKINSIDTRSLTLGHQSIAECLIKTRWYNPFPKIRTTERPDAAAASILEGCIVLICDNSPEAMIFPTSIFDFLQETDDYYFPPLTGTYLRFVRMSVFFLTMFVTPAWYLILMYSNILPDQFKFLIPADPGAVPIIMQLYLTEFAIDGLKLASMNTPNALSNSLSVVGGLLLGDIAIKVGWLCPDVILYMSFVAIANFTQSSYELGYAFKFFRMIMLFLTWLLGLWGFIAGFLLFIVIVSTNLTVNRKRSYLYPLIPFNPSALARLVFRLKKKD